MPGVLQQPNLLNLPDWVKTANIQNGAVTLAKLANLANATVIGRNTAGTGVPEAVTMAQLVELFEAALEANALDWTVLQSFLAGLRLKPGATLSGPLEGTLWYELTGGRLMIRDATASIPLLEVGTWTPQLRPDTIGSSNIVYSTQAGTYVKMGRRMWVDINIQTSTLDLTGASGTMRIIGLPYTMANNASQIGGSVLPLFGLNLATTAGLQSPFIWAVINSTQLVFRRVVTGANTTTGLLAVGSTNGFLGGQNVTIQGSMYIGRTNEA